MTQAAPANYVWWLAGRSAGIVAMLLITCSVILGLAMAARVIPPRWRRDAVRVHQHLALIALGAIAAHGLLLAADPWLKAGLKGIVVPFAIGYRPLWTGLGILGGYLAAILALSFYVRRRIGARLWRRMHRFTVMVYVLALVHCAGIGNGRLDCRSCATRCWRARCRCCSCSRCVCSARARVPVHPHPRCARLPHSMATAWPKPGPSGAAPAGAPTAGRYASGLSIAPSRGQMEPLPSRGS